MLRDNEEKQQFYSSFARKTMNAFANEAMKRFPMPMTPTPSPSSIHAGSGRSPVMQDLLWISKQQQQHPSTHAHPLKNTIRVSSNGIRHKFDGKQWRPLCKSPDAYECRNLAFRSSLCQKHFYKLHLFKRPYLKNRPAAPSDVAPMSFKRPISQVYEHKQGTDDDVDGDDSIQLLENYDPMPTKRHCTQTKEDNRPELTFFSIDYNSQRENDSSNIYGTRSESLQKMKRSDSTNDDSVISNDSETLSLAATAPKVTESVRLGLPPLTRTEEKSLAHELIAQLPIDASVVTGEQWARRRASEIVLDNYAHHISPMNIHSEWFYDFLLRHPRVPIHFQLWFSSVNSALPASDRLSDIKIWELSLVTRSITSSASLSTSSSSP